MVSSLCLNVKWIKNAWSAILLTCFLSTGLLSKDYRSLKTQFLQVKLFFLDVIIRCAVKGPVTCVMLYLVGLLRVTAQITCSRLPTSGNWGCWWSSNRAKRWPWWRAKWANWSMTKRQVIKQSFCRSIDHTSNVSISFFCFFSFAHKYCARFYFFFTVGFSGKLTDAFSSLTKKSNFRALSRRLNLVCIVQDFTWDQSAKIGGCHMSSHLV